LRAADGITAAALIRQAILDLLERRLPREFGPSGADICRATTKPDRPT
jgi:hypothetical protein